MSNTLPPPPRTTPSVRSGPSQFTSTHLAMLADPDTAYLLPLAVIAHIDLNAFFAQCEQLRLGKAITDPVVCCQWLSLIAISYAARKYGISRMDSLKSAQEKCPGLVVGHAAVFKKGQSHWQYLNLLPDQAIHKVSLDPYRRELRKIIKILKQECDLVEKASVDECYLDFGRMVHSRVLELFPSLAHLDENVPLPPVPSELPPDLYWVGEVVPTAKEAHEQIEREAMGDENLHTEKPAPPIADWDDLCILIGSQIMYRIRGEVYKQLQYTTSGGVASSKPVAKIAGGFIKPDMQTVVRPRLTEQFLTKFELADFTLMGGKTGEIAMQRLGVPPDTHSITYIRENWDLDALRKEYPNEEPLADKIFQLVRGTNRLKLKLRTDVKSMMSRKNFLSRHPVASLADAYDWIRVYLGDLYGRLIELDDENMNLSMLQQNSADRGFIYRPRTVSVQVTFTTYSRTSKQTHFLVLKNLDKFKAALEATGFRLLCEIMEQTKAAELNPGVRFRDLKPSDDLKSVKIPPLANMCLVVSNFVKTSDQNLIDSYGNNEGGSTQEVIKRLFDEVNVPKEIPEPKKKLVRSNSYIRKLFEDFESENVARAEVQEKPKLKNNGEYARKMFADYETSKAEAQAQVQVLRSSSPKEGTPEPNTGSDNLLEELIRQRFCAQCSVAVDDVFEHRDYHVALVLSQKLNGNGEESAQTSPNREERHRKNAVTRGQSRLPFNTEQRG